MFRLRPRNQHVAIYVERQAVELRFAGDVLNRLASEAAFNEIAEGAGRIGRKRLVLVRNEPSQVRVRRIFPERMQKQCLRIAPRALGVRTLGESLLCRIESEAESGTSVRRGRHAT